MSSTPFLPRLFQTRWLRYVYPGQARLDALLPASAVSLETVSAYANRGELLAVGSTEGGVHPELAVFLGSDIQPIGERSRHSAVSRTDFVVDNESYGVVVVGSSPGATTVLIKPGFRIILFADSLSFSRVRLLSVDANRSERSTNSTPLFLEDLPNALARLQLIRFGGVDCVGSGPPAASSCDDDPLCNTQGENRAVDDSDDNDASSSNMSQRQQGAPIPALVLAGLGLGRAPGFETSMTLGGRLQEHIIGAFRSAVGGAQVTDSAAALAKAQRDTLCYSNQLSAAHEAVLALLSARPRCFDPAVESVPSLESGIPSGGQSRTGVSDEIERDQNRIINNLIETISAYQNTLKQAHDVVPACDRGSQAELAQKLSSDRRVGHRLASSIVRTLARMSEMLHAWGLDPALYCPTSSGVRTLVYDVVHRAASAKHEEDEQRRQDEEMVERSILHSLTEIFVTRVARECTWVVPMAAMAGIRPDDFPARGWWDTCIVLLADRHKVGHSTRSQFDLPSLVGMTPPSAVGKRADTEKVGFSKHSTRPLEQQFVDVRGEEREGPEQAVATEQRLEQVHSIVGVWLDHEDPAVHVQATRNSEYVKCSSFDSDESDDLTEGRVTLSPHHWELGFDTSDWTRNGVTLAALEFARKRSKSAIPSEAVDMPHEKNAEATARDADSSGEHMRKNCEPFFTRLSELWNTAKEERSNLSPAQAVAAGRFCQDDVLRRLVLLEATMNDLFARLPCYVLCQPDRWANWIEVVGNNLRSTELGLSGAMKLLHSHLSNPPPVFASTVGRVPSADGAADFKCSRDGSTSSSSNSSSTDTASDENDSDSGDDAVPRPSRTKGQVAELDDSADEVLSAGGSAVELVTGTPRVRRDSRERIKVMLGHLDGADGGLTRDNSEGLMVSTEEFLSRATNLFGVSSHAKGAGIKRVPFSKKPAGREQATMSPGVAKSFSYPRSDAEGSDGDSDRKDEYITFVAESFRPKRDNSDWHREVISAPPPTPVPATPPAEPVATAAVTVIPDEDGENVDDAPATTEDGKSDNIPHSKARKKDNRQRKDKHDRTSEAHGRDALVTKPRSEQPQNPR